MVQRCREPNIKVVEMQFCTNYLRWNTVHNSYLTKEAAEMKSPSKAESNLEEEGGNFVERVWPSHLCSIFEFDFG